MDYNNNSKIDKTLEAFKKIANSREDLYVFTYEDDTLQLHNINHLTEEKAEDDIIDLGNDINETMKKYCQFEIITGKNIWGQTVYRAGNYQTSAYFIQVLALIAAKSGYGIFPAIGILTGNSIATNMNLLEINLH